ncbi:MAG: NAD(P)H-hydrate dehydratase, partial [Aedoeadaptatus pacaensis]
FRLSVSHEKDYAVAIARLEDPRAFPLSKEVANLLPVIQQTDHKGSRGRAALVGGSEGMYGSVDLSSSAALRAGCGLSYAFVPDEIFKDFSLRMREVIVKKQSDISELTAMDAIGLGPGMGRGDEARDVFLHVYGLTTPMVVDADGLYHLAQEKPTAGGEKIYTPHEGEMARLLDRDISWVRDHRDEAVDEFLACYGGVVVLKGHESIVASKDQRAINETGNAGMATAGSGDVLTGIITACLAQGMNCFQAARLGVYIHGLAGDLGALHKSERGLIASDLITYLPEAFLRLEAERESVPEK